MKEKIVKCLRLFYRSYIWLFIVLLGLDIFTKQLMMHLPVDEEGHIAKWGFVNISFTLNDGAAFGIGTGREDWNRIIYLIVASLVSIGLTAYLILKRKETKLFVRAALIMVITGAIGNTIDRIFYGPLQGETGLFTGKVVDWIDFYWFWHYIFNIADCCIVIAAFMLIIYFIVGEVKEFNEKRKSEMPQGKVLSKTEKERLEAENQEEEKSE
ncbi:MAG: signal peptidase II [Bacilli bacterium]|nr:signal peptidase II [Bacilli bacterium]